MAGIQIIFFERLRGNQRLKSSLGIAKREGVVWAMKNGMDETWGSLSISQKRLGRKGGADDDFNNQLVVLCMGEGHWNGGIDKSIKFSFGFSLGIIIR